LVFSQVLHLLVSIVLLGLLQHYLSLLGIQSGITSAVSIVLLGLLQHYLSLLGIQSGITSAVRGQRVLNKPYQSITSCHLC
jgi:hypothetical protein